MPARRILTGSGRWRDDPGRMTHLAFLGLPEGAGDLVSVVLGLLLFAVLFAVLEGLDRV